MALSSDQLLSEALHLSEPERLALASELLASVEGPGDPENDGETDNRRARPGFDRASAGGMAGFTPPPG